MLMVELGQVWPEVSGLLEFQQHCTWLFQGFTFAVPWEACLVRGSAHAVLLSLSRDEEIPLQGCVTMWRVSTA